MCRAKNVTPSEFTVSLEIPAADAPTEEDGDALLPDGVVHDTPAAEPPAADTVADIVESANDVADSATGVADESAIGADEPSKVSN
ncbi:MAG: hypothetical protein ACRDCT_27120, partial [Shewanella sp.]